MKKKDLEDYIRRLTAELQEATDAQNSGQSLSTLRRKNDINRLNKAQFEVTKAQQELADYRARDGSEKADKNANTDANAPIEISDDEDDIKQRVIDAKARWRRSNDMHNGVVHVIMDDEAEPELNAADAAPAEDAAQIKTGPHGTKLNSQQDDE